MSTKQLDIIRRTAELGVRMTSAGPREESYASMFQHILDAAVELDAEITSCVQQLERFVSEPEVCIDGGHYLANVAENLKMEAL